MSIESCYPRNLSGRFGVISSACVPTANRAPPQEFEHHDNARDQRPEPHQELRPDHGRGRHLLSGPARRTGRVPRPQRRGEIHLHAHPHDLAPRLQRLRVARRLRRDVPVDGGPQAHRLPARERAALPRDARPRVPRSTAPSSRASNARGGPPVSTTVWRSAASRKSRAGCSARSRRVTASASASPMPCSPIRPS